MATFFVEFLTYRFRRVKQILKKLIKEHPIQHIVAYTHDNTLMLLLPYLSIMIKNTQWSKIRKKMQFKVVSMFTSKTKQKILKAR